ncbi:hypothetical protein TIFTF001_026925 [Ficus carica]|uniref:Glycine-rich protein n=1 Tax=Ficus carica TaxID=3494 RepID=A0AA88DM18_FICCA|nr:hypothetical protein TIFTF001_026925 [Ficus carica]
MGSVIAGVIILSLLYAGGSKKQTTLNPIAMKSVTTPSDQPSHTADIERGEGKKSTRGDKDGGLVIFEGAGAALEISSCFISGGGGGGGGGGGCCFGGGCGGCGGCGG